jgi:hypothetical protein
MEVDIPNLYHVNSKPNNPNPTLTLTPPIVPNPQQAAAEWRNEQLKISIIVASVRGAAPGWRNEQLLGPLTAATGR